MKGRTVAFGKISNAIQVSAVAEVNWNLLRSSNTNVRFFPKFINCCMKKEEKKKKINK